MLVIKASEDMPATLSLSLNVRLTRSGKAMRYIYDKSLNPTQNVNTSLIRLIVQAHRYWHMLRNEQINMTQLAERENLNRSWVIAVLRLAFLSPQITNAIFAGTHSAKLNGKTLRIANAVDLRWSIQERTFCRDS